MWRRRLLRSGRMARRNKCISVVFCLRLRFLGEQDGIALLLVVVVMAFVDVES